MPPLLALILTFSLIAYLFWREGNRDYKPSFALWIPSIWLLLLGSRAVSLWLNLGSSSVHMVDYAAKSSTMLEEGSPLDRAVFFLLIALSIGVLIGRRISWGNIVRNNVWLILFFVYCGLSTIWSDFAFVAFKRWTKGLGDPLVMLVILTEPQPIKALEIVIRRCAYLLLPISVLFVKYYPHLGKAYDDWTGVAMYTGITTNKNMLGLVCMVCGLYFIWKIFGNWGKRHMSEQKQEIVLAVFFLSMIAYLFNLADSKTSLMTLFLAIGIMVVLGVAAVRRRFGTYVIAGALSFAVLQLSFNVMDFFIESAGRNATLTGRTEIWSEVLGMGTNPIIGTGFESFWLGERLQILWEKYYFKPNQAHNGYIEIYLNLGWVGLCLLGGLLFSCYRNMRELLMSARDLPELIHFGRLGMAFLAGYLVYNYTEAAFKAEHFMFLFFLAFAIQYPQPQQRVAQSSPSFPETVGEIPAMEGDGGKSLSHASAV